MNNCSVTLEVCAGSYESALSAYRGGARRVELCSALSEGGITPSVSLIGKTASIPGLEVYVLIRPRGGDFLYTEDEADIMAGDVEASIAAGCNGIVIGALTKEGDIDTHLCQRLISVAKEQNKEIGITFHRAFDVCRDPYDALEKIISLGFDRILTSGCAQSAMDGASTIRRLVEQSAGRISIMAGGGVSVENAGVLVARTGVSEIHASARSPRHSTMKFRRGCVNMGVKGADEYMLMETDADQVRQIVKIIS